jgi:hypothetical protein
MPIWPSSLPRKPLDGSYREAPAPNTTGTENDVGDPIMRRRFTGRTVKFSGAIHLTDAQKNTFDTFWADTLSQGSLQFSMASWSDGVIRDHNFQFGTVPDFSHQGGVWTCVLALQYTVTS